VADSFGNESILRLSRSSPSSVRAESEFGILDVGLLRLSLEDARMEDLSVWAVMPTRHYLPARVKVFLEALEQELAAIPRTV